MFTRLYKTKNTPLIEGNKKKLLQKGVTVLGLITLAGGFCILGTSGESTNIISAGPLSLTPQKIHSLALIDTEDEYDARDEFNHPVKSKSASRELQNLFVGGVYILLAKTEIHSISKIREFLSRVVNPSVLAFAASIWQVVCKNAAAIISQFKRQAEITLLPFIYIPLLSVTLLQFSYLIFTPKSRVAPLILRC